MGVRQNERCYKLCFDPPLIGDYATERLDLLFTAPLQGAMAI
jgi:hypothetical protein